MGALQLGADTPEAVGEDSQPPPSLIMTTTTDLDDKTDQMTLNGDASKGDAIKGDAVNGDAVNGDAVNGDAANGDAGEDWDEDTAMMIRRQVAYYFSDENLEVDDFLRAKMKESKNKPVPLHIIHNFKKMRDFQPVERVLHALQSSATVKVITHVGRPCIVRHVLYVPTREKPPKATGFEENFTEGPIRPEEHAEDLELYDPSESFAVRIECAVSMFRRKRHFLPGRLDKWIKFLKFGGFDTVSLASSNGKGQLDEDEMTLREQLLLRATERVDLEKGDQGPNAHWKVDFNGVARAFMHWDEDVINTLVGFYNYLLHHDVCPEYEADILAARESCRLARWQMPRVHACQETWPGLFNAACAMAYAGLTLDDTSVDSHLMDDDDSVDDTQQPVKTDSDNADIDKQQPASFVSDKAPMTRAEARRAYQQGLSSIGRAHMHQDRIVASEEDTGFEVAAIHLAGASDGLATIECTPWTPVTFAEWDLPEGALPEQRRQSFAFYLDAAAAQHAFVGLKFVATVCTLRSGLQYMAALHTVHPSYYTVLYNELLYHGGSVQWKEPRVIPREVHLAKEERRRQAAEDTAQAKQVQAKQAEQVEQTDKPEHVEHTADDAHVEDGVHAAAEAGETGETGDVAAAA